MTYRPRRAKIVAGDQMKYKILLEQTEEGYSVSCPGLPGCWSQGETEDEAVENIQDAIREYLAAIDDLVNNANVREVEIGV
jgi:predicted RNase H-like HicB family nuclease